MHTRLTHWEGFGALTNVSQLNPISKHNCSKNWESFFKKAKLLWTLCFSRKPIWLLITDNYLIPGCAQYSVYNAQCILYTMYRYVIKFIGKIKISGLKPRIVKVKNTAAVLWGDCQYWCEKKVMQKKRRIFWLIWAGLIILTLKFYLFSWNLYVTTRWSL